MDADLLLETPLIITETMTDDEIAAEYTAAIQRQKMTQQFVEGKIDAETYLDFMAEQGFEACDLLDIAEQNLEFCIKEGIEVTR